MPGNVFEAIITVLDKATAPLRAIDLEAAKIGAPFRQIGIRVAELGEATGLAKLAEAGRNAGEHFRELGSQIRDMAAPLAALGAAAGLGGIAEAVKHASEYGANLYDTAQKIGIASDQLAKWRFAASLAGTDTASLDKGLEYLNRTIGEALSGRSQQMALMFSRLGISLRDGTGHARDASVVMGDLADAVKKNQNSPVILAQIAQAMGMRSGAELLPLLREGKAGLAETSAEAEKYGLVMSDAGTRSAKAFDDSFKKMGFALQGVSNAIGEKLFPVLQPMLQGMADWVAANRAVIATDVENVVTGLGSALKSIDWAGLKTVVKAIGEGFKFVESWIGPTATALGLAAVAAAPLVMAFGGATWSLALLGKQFVVFAARTAMMAFAPLVAGMSDFVTALRAGYGAMTAFDLAMDANPIGLVVIALAALAGAAYVVFTHWDQFKTNLMAIWTTVSGFVTQHVDIILAAFGPLGAAAGLIVDHWGAVRDFFKALFTDLASLFDAGWNKLRPIIEPLLKAGSELEHLLGFGGGDTSPDADAGAPAPAAAPQPPRLYGGAPGNAAPAAPGGKHELTVPAAPGGKHELTVPAAPGGKHELTVRIQNAPPGTSVSSRSSGNAAPPHIDVGYAWATP